MGRIQRRKEGKKTPVMTVFEDANIRPLRALCQSIRHSLKEWQFKFDTVIPERLPTELPASVKRKYDETLSQLSPDEVDDE
jgi:hypothetical protein